MEYYTRGSLRFDVIDRGSDQADAVVALHGFPQSARSWSAVSERLVSAGYRVLAPDQRGYSPNARPRERRSYVLDELVSDVLALIDAAGTRQVHVLGHDFGGIVGWALATRAPQRLHSLTIVSTPHPRAFTATLLTSREILLSWYMAFFQIPRLPEALIRYNSGHHLLNFLTDSGLSAQIARSYVDRLMEDPGLATAALNWYRALPRDIRFGLTAPHVGVPTLYVLGERCQFVSRKAATATGRWVTGPYRFAVLKDATHWIPEQHHQELADFMLHFITSHRADRA
jgi:pimeloyl-ACP methyl ester carboxylesterase